MGGQWACSSTKPRRRLAAHQSRNCFGHSCQEQGTLAAGPEGGSPVELWAAKPGEKALSPHSRSRKSRSSRGRRDARDFRRILEGVLDEEVRDPVLRHSDVMI